jgi:hypothetical protein
MKQILQIIFCIGLAFKIFGQINCDHGIVTNWVGPVNISLPYTLSSPTTPDIAFLNAFNWTSPNPIQLSNMQYNQQMVALKNPQQMEYYGYIYNGEELSPNNGWELMLFNIGTYANLTSNLTAEIPDIPYIVLYNRYTGIVRVFANYGSGYLPSGISFDAVKVTLKMDESSTNKNGLLRLANGIDQTLDQNTNITQIVTLAKHPNAPGKWFSSDFQITYDPCICYFPSDMRINFEFIESQTVELHARGISIEQDLITGNAINTNNFLSDFDYSGNTANGGMIMYKAMETFVNDYELKLTTYQTELALTNEHNAQVDRNLAVIKLFKHTVLQGGNSIITDIAGMPWFGEVITFANDLVGDTVLTKKKIIEETKKQFAKGLDQLIAKNFKKMPTPTSPSTPMATFTEMHFQGLLQNATYLGGPIFYTPGTYGTSGTGSPILLSNLKYPIYNDPLGVFALLEQPKLGISKNIADYAYTVSEFPADLSYQTWTKYYQLKLVNDLKYRLNPSLDIKSHSIQVGYEIVAKRKNVNLNYLQAYMNLFNDPIYTTNVESSNLNEKKYYPLIFNRSTDFTIINSIESSFNLNEMDKDTIEYSSLYLPIDAFSPLILGIGLKNEISTPFLSQLDELDLIDLGYEYDFEIKLKMIVDIEFNTPRSDGSANSLTQIHTFIIKPEDITWLTSPIVPNLATTSDNIGQYPQNMNLSSTNFNGQAVVGCDLVGNAYTCQAWNDIVISGDLTTSNGYNVSIKAGNQINVLGESNISPEIVLSIAPVLDYSHPMSEATASYVQSFCQGTLGGNAPSYHANIPAKSLAISDSSEINNYNENHTSFSWNFNLYPNPASINSFVKIDNSHIIVSEISIYDLTGSKIETQIFEIEKNVFELNFTNCSKGLYFVKVSTLEGTQTKQLIIE